MPLSSDLISQFVKITKDTNDTKSEKTVYGTIVEYDGYKYVKLDGSDLLTPISSTTNVGADDRVTVTIKNHNAIVTGNITSPSATTSDVEAVDSKVESIGTKISEFEIIVADKVDTKELNAANARIDALQADNVTIHGTLTANNASIKQLEADNVTINGTLDVHEGYFEDLKAVDVEITGKLEANDADIDDLQADNVLIRETLTANNASIKNLEAYDVEVEGRLVAQKADIANLEANKLSADEAELKYATIENLNVEKARIDSLDADVADIDTLIFGSASGNVIQTSFANAVIAQLGNAQIKSAMIENISASQIVSGDIITNNVRVKSEDGSLVISDETIQISDDTRVRVQIGKDAKNDYSINIWDADGNLMFSEGGITDSAIKDAIIRNDMVSNDANISASKLDISSLFKEINGSTETIKATRIYLDDESQTLDVAFTSMSSDVDSLEDDVSSHGTQISAIQGQISSKIWQQDIDTAVGEVEDKTETLSTKYSALEQEVDSIAATVSSHTTEIAKKADSSTVTTVNDRVAAVEMSLDGFKSSVSSTYATKSEVNTVAGELEEKTDELSTQYSTLDQSLDGLTATVSSHTTEIAKKADSSTVTSVSNRVNTVETNLNGLSATVSNHATEIAKKADNSTVTTVSNRVSELETGLNGFKSTVSETYATKTEVDKATGELENKTEALSTQHSALEQEVDSIAATVSSHTTEIAKKADNSTVTTVSNRVTELESDLDGFEVAVSETYTTKTEFNDLQIGGRNYLRETYNMQEWKFGSTSYGTFEQGLDGATVADFGAVSERSYNANIISRPFINYSRVRGKTMMFSMMIRSDNWVGDPSDRVLVSFLLSGPDEQRTWYYDAAIVGKGESVDAEWTKLSIKVTLTDDFFIYNRSAYPDFVIDDTTLFAVRVYNYTLSHLQFKYLKLEEGTRVTDWTPAPEDIEDDIIALGGDVTSISSEIASLQVDVSSITASVSSVETVLADATDNLSKNITSLSKQVESKITSEEVSYQIQTALDDGVEKVVTSTGYTFDKDGLTVHKSDSEMKTQITDDGMTVYKNDEAVLTANSVGVDAVNLHATTYLIIGNNSRLEDWGDRTACFWIGN